MTHMLTRIRVSSAGIFLVFGNCLLRWSWVFPKGHVLLLGRGRTLRRWEPVGGVQVVRDAPSEEPGTLLFPVSPCFLVAGGVWLCFFICCLPGFSVSPQAQNKESSDHGLKPPKLRAERNPPSLRVDDCSKHSASVMGSPLTYFATRTVLIRLVPLSLCIHPHLHVHGTSEVWYMCTCVHMHVEARG